MIVGADMYRKAVRVFMGLRERVREGIASLAERERSEAIRDHILVYEWAEDDRPAEPTLPPPPRPSYPRASDPAVLSFCDWWERVCTTEKWAPDPWRAGLLFWWHPRGLDTLTEELEIEAECELLARDLVEPDAVSTDPFDWFDHDRADAA